MNVLNRQNEKIPLHIFIYKYYEQLDRPTTIDEDRHLAYSLFCSCELMYPDSKINQVAKVKQFAITFKQALPRPLRVQYVRDKQTKKYIKHIIFDEDIAVDKWIRTMSNWRNN